MIVRDESVRLAACLASAEGAVDEVVVVDTGSRDGTADLARDCGARVIQWAWRDDFAAARNESLRHAGGDWVLVLDADERLAPGAAARVRALVATGAADGFDCELVSALPPDQPAPTMSHWYCRLFRRREGIRFEGRIHEQVAPSIVASGGRIARGDVRILHGGYAEASPAKLERNLALLRLALSERPGDAFTLLNLGLALHGAGQFRAAAEAFERAAVSTVAPLARELRAVACTKLAEARMAQADWHGAAQAARQALVIEPGLAIARYVLGRALFELGAVEAAEPLFDLLAEAHPDVLGITLRPHVVAVARAIVRLRQRRWQEAAEVLAPVADEDPTGEAVFHLGNAYLGLGRLAAAVSAYGTARSRGVTDPSLERRLAIATRLAGPEPAARGGRS
jgi:tetratricopeptide (TPR) repeat protein